MLDDGAPKWVSVRRGRSYENFTEGQSFEHHWGRTLSETDNLLFTTLTLHFNPTYFNVEVARARGYDRIPVNPLLVLGTAISLSVEDLSELSEAFLGIDDVVFHQPFYPGDTLSARSEVAGKRRSKSRPGFGVVSWRTEGRDQRGSTKVSFRRANLFRVDDGDELHLRQDQEGGADVSAGSAVAADGAQEQARLRTMFVRDPLYFEDFQVGQRIRHARGKTVTEMDNVLLSNLMLNTADGHFNQHTASVSSFGERMVFGGVIAGLVIGLSAAETGESAVRELGLDKMRFRLPVFHGDTLYAASEVLELASSPSGGGRVGFHHWGFNQRGEVVFECDRSVIIAARPGAR
jgi:2-methylfumaryl-CoA hydratase